MKKIFLLLLTIPFLATSQIGKKESVKEWVEFGKLTNPYKYFKTTYQEYDDSRLYKISFQNMKYTEITDICTFTFEASDEELLYFKNFLIEGTQLKTKDEDISLEVGQGVVMLSPLAGKNVTMWYIEDGKPAKHTWLSLKQIDKVLPIN